MRHILTIDRKDYDPNGTREVRPSVRGIILREGKVLMVHSLKYDYYKFPGGGIEPGEDRLAALCREVREESGYEVLPDSIREFGMVLRISKGEKRDVFYQENFYYLCDVTGPVGQQLDDYEAEERFTPEFVEPKTVIESNRFHDHGGKDGVMLEREALVLEALAREGFLSEGTGNSGAHPL